MEIEFKLSCTPEAAAVLGRHLSRLTGATPQKVKLQNSYYDTPQQDLRAHGIALRIRQQGTLRLQTVKCAGSVSGGLSSRPEWETPYTGRFDFSPVSDSTVRGQLEILARLPGYRATLETNFSRHIWHWQPEAGTHVEIMLDRGRILAGGREDAICELELELVAGQPERLLDLAAALGNLVPLFPAPLSKATRGNLLLAGKRNAALPPPPPSDNDGCAAIFTAQAQACLDQISVNLPANCSSFDAENLHQVRVGMRRLRALLQLFRPALRKDWCRREIQAGAREHMQAVAPARSLHVLIEDILLPAEAELDPRGWKHLHERLCGMEGLVFAAARNHLLSQPFAWWLLQTSLALHAKPLRGKWRALAWPKAADKLLDLRLKDYAQHLRAAKPDPETLHELRKAGKHLRYQLAICVPKTHGKALRRQLASLQDSLGQINDLHSAGEVLNRQTPSYAKVIADLGAFHSKRHAALHAELPEQLRRLRTELSALRKEKR